jgi:hypothetical protein
MIMCLNIFTFPFSYSIYLFHVFPQLRRQTQSIHNPYENLFLYSIPRPIFFDTWQCVKTNSTPGEHQNSWDLWMFIPLKMVLIGIDPYPHKEINFSLFTMFMGWFIVQ